MLRAGRRHGGLEAPREMTEFDHAAVPLFGGVSTSLVEQGFLDPDMCSPRLAEWISLWGQ
jgi:hypothetical protein